MSTHRKPVTAPVVSKRKTRHGDDPLVMVEIIEPKYIDPYYLDQPTLALDRVRMEIARMGSHALSMVRDSMPVLTVGTGERIDSLKKRDDEIDILHKAIIIYLHQLSSGDLLNPLPARLYRYVTTANSIENVADIATVRIHLLTYEIVIKEPESIYYTCPCIRIIVCGK